MLSIGIKNSILVILIILIIHVFLKNLVVEQTRINTKQENETFTIASQSTLKPFDIQKDNIVLKSDTKVDRYGGDIQSKEDICRNTKVKDLQLNKLLEDEMLEYVKKGDDDNDDTENLDKYFKDNIVSENVKVLENKYIKNDPDVCKFKEDNHQLPLSTTCNTNIQKINSKEIDKTVIADCNLSQDKKNIMILNQYANENTMNGGLLYGDLEAYDTFDTNYEEYSCKI
jgi:hypothetical protein